jgi:hypothetical protein
VAGFETLAFVTSRHKKTALRPPQLAASSYSLGAVPSTQGPCTVNILPREKQIEAVAALTEGVRLASTRPMISWFSRHDWRRAARLSETPAEVKMSSPRIQSGGAPPTGHPIIRSFEPGEDWRWLLCARKHLPHRIAASDIYQRDERGRSCRAQTRAERRKYRFCWRQDVPLPSI